MSKGARGPRLLSKKFTVLCEGKTEACYIDGLKTWLASEHPEVKVSVERINVGGGGYAEFEKRLRAEPDSNCLARFVLLDYDRCLSNPNERRSFSRLVEMSYLSRSRRVPLILVVSNESFEYALCCHDPDYRGGNPDSFLVRKWGYRDSADVKSDSRVWDKAHLGHRGHAIAVKRLSGKKRLLNNVFVWEKASLRLRLKEVSYSAESEISRSSNLGDLFRALGVC